MTVGTKMMKAVSDAESLHSQLTKFALETQDQNAKAMFNELAQTTQQVVASLTDRLNYIQNEEPEFKKV